MPIALVCPGCRKQYEVDSALAGKKSRCNHCGAMFRIPASDDRESERASSSSPSPVVGAQPSAATASTSAPRAAPGSSWESILKGSSSSGVDSRSPRPRTPADEPGSPPADSIVIHCPGCGKRYELSAALAGKKSRCRQCGEVFAIAVPQFVAREPETVTMTLLPDEPAAATLRNPPESHWESAVADDPGDIQVQQPPKPPDYDDFAVPAPIRAKPRVMKTKRGQDSGLGLAISGSFSIALLVLFAGAYGAGFLGLLSKSQVSGFVGISLSLTMFVCGILILWGTIWLVVVAFREEMRCGLMFLFVPLYPLYYIWTRMAETKGPASMVAVAYFVIFGLAILGPAFDPDRASVGQLQSAAALPAPAIVQTPPQLAIPVPEPMRQPDAGIVASQKNLIPPGFGPAFGGRQRGLPLPGNIPPVGPPAQFLERWENHLRAISNRYGSKAVILVFTGVPANSDPARGVTSRDVLEAITQRVKALVPGIETVMNFGTDNNKALIVAPVDNPAALAQGIDFGKAALQRDTRIRVDLSPEFVASVPRLPPEPAWAAGNKPEPRRPEVAIPAGADPVTRSLLQLKSLDMGQIKEAVHRLERTTPDHRIGEVAAALLPLLSEDDGFLVNDVIKALIVWRTPDVLPALIRRTEDNRFFVRKEAVKALGKFQDDRAIKALIAHLKEDRFEAEAALKEIGPMAEPALIARLRDPNPRIRSVACEILQEVGGADALKKMRALPVDPDLGARMAAKRAMELIAARVGRVR
jgi:hypothetical protein